MTLDEGGWRRSKVHVIAPPPALRDIVESFSVDQWSPAECAARTSRVVADDAPHILWQVTPGRVLRTQRLVMVGARTRHYDVDLSGRRVMIGARLRPGAIPMLARGSASTLTNRTVALADVATSSIERTIRRLRPTSVEEAVHELAAMIERMRDGRGQHVDARTGWVAQLDRAEMPSVSTVGRMFSMSPRTVRAWSIATFGMGLKRLLRIRRLHAALELRLSGTHDTWSRVAAAAGYADQPHLNRDCRELLAESPAEFVARGA